LAATANSPKRKPAARIQRGASAPCVDASADLLVGVAHAYSQIGNIALTT
jgi:hypothetical protein